MRVRCLIWSSITLMDHSKLGPPGPSTRMIWTALLIGRQGIAEFVGEHGEELILALIGVFERFLHALAVVDVGHDDACAEHGPLGCFDGVKAAEPVTLLPRLRGCFAGNLLVHDARTRLENLPDLLGKRPATIEGSTSERVRPRWAVDRQAVDCGEGGV